jgi:hypothetical protein
VKNPFIALTLFATVSVAQPEVVVDCPAGMHFVKGKGCAANIGQQPTCPAGTRFAGGKCMAIIDTSCPAGMHFVEGTGCLASAKKETKPAAKPVEKATKEEVKEEPSDGKQKKSGSFSGGFSDHFKAECSGHAVEVLGRSKIIGGAVMFMIDDKKIGDEISIGVGQTKNIEGAVGGKQFNLKVQQGLWGTRYTVTVNGTECKLGR